MKEPMDDVAYQLNAADEIVFVNDDWVRFALANQGEAYLPEKVLHHKIWDFIKDDLSVQLYRQIFERVRGGRAFQFSFRCDAPERRRLLEMTIRPGKDGGLELETKPLWVQHRAPQKLLENVTATHPEETLLMCGWCKRINVGDGNWEEVEDAVVRLGLFERQESVQVSHGICQRCYDQVFKKLDENKAD